ncbi:acyl-CoA ligase (AMP-forming), exosortase A system-associated [Streptomyces sp. NPDC056452]|uniref:acyl-CoA ligase (AMP-forming), exosortase A system-associated n=1 Tax=Streptomyces sp. NPDC056452 TaxID=3345821 RepID=UPI00368A0B35
MAEGRVGFRSWRPPPVRLDQLTGHGDPERPALTFRSRTLTYADLADRVTRAANGLRGLGVRRGDRVAVYSEKRIEAVVAFLAVSAAGAVLVPVNPVFRTRHLAHILSDSGARTLITTAERLDTVRAAVGSSPVDHVVLVNGPDARPPDGGGPVTVPWSVLAEAEPAPVPDPGLTDADIAAILYTSGSTGPPKGVVLSHRNMIAGAESVAGYLGHTEQDVILAVLPLSFDAGFSQLTTGLIAGAHVVLADFLLPGEIVRLCAAHRVTALTCVPPLWIRLAGQTWPAEATAHLRYFANTGGRMPRTTLAALRAAFPKAKPYLMYGLTEAFRSTYLDPEQVDDRPDSIGRAVPNAEVLVVRPDGSPCAPGEHGELVHRGPLVALGYWNAPELTARRFRPSPGGAGGVDADRSVWSGDVVYGDDEGYLYFVGRDDDMIKTSGYRVSPTEIEEAVYATGLTEEAVALGVDDERLGQCVVLAVSGPCDVDSLHRALARELPRYMVPARTVVLTGLPRSPNGKFDRVSIREQVSQ